MNVAKESCNESVLRQTTDHHWKVMPSEIKYKIETQNFIMIVDTKTKGKKNQLASINLSIKCFLKIDKKILTPVAYAAT